MCQLIDRTSAPSRLKTALIHALKTVGLTLVILAVSAASASYRFGSIANALAFVRGERFLVQGPLIETGEATPN